jgi:hypothetical protein
VAAGLTFLGEQLKPWARPWWARGRHAPRTSAEILALASLKAQSIAHDAFRDIPDLTVVSESISEPAKPDDASATVVMRTSDGDIITVHIWFADGGIRHTATRTRSER